MELQEIRDLITLIKSAESMNMEAHGKRIAFGPDIIAEILAALEYWHYKSGEG